MLQNFSQTQGTVFHSSACISSSEGFFKNRSAHFCGKSPSSGACSSQIAILLSLGLKFLMKWKPTYIYGDLNFSESKQVFANLFSWRKLDGSLIISWKFQGRTPQEIWIRAIFPARSKVVSYDVLHHTGPVCNVDPLSIVNREPQERVSPRNRPHCYTEKMIWKEQLNYRDSGANTLKTLFPSFINPLAKSTFSFNRCCFDFFLFPSTDA